MKTQILRNIATHRLLMGNEAMARGLALFPPFRKGGNL
jgi:hypothetical protein